MRIIPTVFAHNKNEFDLRFQKLLPISKDLQIDFMDGKFVPAKSISLSQIPDLSKYKNNFEAHLMIKNPERYLQKLKSKGFKKVIFHLESTANPQRVAKKITTLGMIPFVAINPETAVKNLSELTFVKGILFMGVHPGKEHQKFINEVYKKIKNFRANNLNLLVQVDGGATPGVIRKLAELKVDFVNSGSYISNSNNPLATLSKLNSSIK